MTARRLLAAAVLPLAAAMTLVASTPWLRAFPPGVILPILLLASVISVAIPPLVATLTGRSVVWSAAASFVVLVVFSLLVVLHDPRAGCPEFGGQAVLPHQGVLDDMVVDGDDLHVVSEH